MKLTHTNYFTDKNKYLSNSKVKDFFKCKEYFYKKHVLGTVERTITPALVTGSAVDTWLTEGRAKFEQLFVPVQRRNLKNPPEGYTEITEAQYSEIVGLCESVERTDAYKYINKHKFTSQEIWQVDMDLGEYFDGICGIPDWYLYDDDTKHCIIVDLKTAQNGSPSKYERHAEKYGYFNQQGMYRWLAKEVLGAETTEHWHLVVEKDSDAIYQVYTYKMNDKRVSFSEEFMRDAVFQIKNEHQFAPSNPDWENAYELGQTDEYNGREDETRKGALVAKELFRDTKKK